MVNQPYDVDVATIRYDMYLQRITNTKMAKELEVSRTTLNSYFKNPHNIPYNIIVKMARVMKYDRDRMTDVFFKQKLEKTQE